MSEIIYTGRLVLHNRAARVICDNNYSFDWDVPASALVNSLGCFSVKERQ